MTPRLDNPSALFPAGFKAMVALEQALAQSIDPELLELVKLRASQINGCAFCIYMHTSDLRKRGVDEMKLYLLNAWRETSLYTERERAALALTEAITRLPDGDVPDEVFDQARGQFSDDELIQVVYVATVINAWNRLAITFRPQIPGTAA